MEDNCITYAPILDNWNVLNDGKSSYEIFRNPWMTIKNQFMTHTNDLCYAQDDL